MSHQTGIEASDSLRQAISKALHGSLRLLQINIENEQLVLTEKKEPHGSWEEDLDNMVPPLLEDTVPCYVFFRFDDRNAHKNYTWIFFSYTPDRAAVRDKMLYAATKATVKREFQSDVVADEVAATSKDELTLQGYNKHVESKQAAPPLTQAEEELKMLHEAEQHADIGTTTRHSHLHGVAFPVDSDALDALVDMKTGKHNYVQLSIDVKKEEVRLERTENGVTANSLRDYIPDTSPRYHFFLFKHTFEGHHEESVVFLYSCPGFKSTIKERMLYSSCKEPVVSVAEKQLGLQVAKKIELESGEELNEAYIMSEVHPQVTAYKPKFNKPPPPGNRKRSSGPSS
ncbi:hypothetical protein EMCRGX_G001071 [Ephydatia muelleri]